MGWNTGVYGFLVSGIIMSIIAHRLPVKLFEYPFSVRNDVRRRVMTTTTKEETLTKMDENDDFVEVLNEDPIIKKEAFKHKSQLIELAAGLTTSKHPNSWRDGENNRGKKALIKRNMFAGLEPKLSCLQSDDGAILLSTTKTEGAADKSVCLSRELMNDDKICLIYSFGIGDDFSFENKMVNDTKCEIHSFDCHAVWEYDDGDSKVTTTNKRIPPSDLTRITFHPWCIGGMEKREEEKEGEEEGELEENSKEDSKVFYRLHEIKELLGHSKRKLAILKMDVEGAEWEVLDDVLPRGAAEVASQVLVELHLGFGCWGKEFRECWGKESFRLKSMPASRVADVAMRFAAAGYGMFTKSLNPRCQLCVEVGYAALSRDAQIAIFGLHAVPELAVPSSNLKVGNDDVGERKNSRAASSTTSCKLALVIPFIQSEIPDLLANFKLWDHFVPCSVGLGASNKMNYSGNNGEDDGEGRVDLIFYSSNDLGNSDKKILANAVIGLSSWHTCFHRYRFISQGLSEANDKYERGTVKIKATGPNIAFFKLFAGAKILKEELKPDYILWMEHDMFPIRELWLQNGLLAEIEGRCDPGADTDFWVKGSVHRGPWMESFDKWNNLQRFFTNGCQLYRYGDPDFDDMLARIVTRWPLTRLQAFDTAFRSFLERTLPRDKGYLQQVVHKFEHTPSIFYYGINLQYKNSRKIGFIPAEAHHAYLYHGPRVVIDAVSGLPRWEYTFDPTYARQLDRIRYANARRLGSESDERKALTSAIKLVEDH